MPTGSWSRNLRWTVVGEVAGKGSVFVTNIILARELGVSGFGTLAAAQAFAAYLWIMADLGIGFYGSREVAKDSERRLPVVSSLFGLRTASGLVAAIGGAGGAYILIEGVTAATYAVAAAQVLFLAMTLDWALRGIQRFQDLSRVSVLGGGVLITGSATVALFPGETHDKITWFLAVWVLSQASMAAASALTLRSIFGKGITLGRIGWSGHLRHSAYFAVSSGMVTAAQYLPILALNHMAGSEAAGVFSAPYRLLLSVITALYMLTSSAYPILSASHANNRQRFTRQFVKTRNTVVAIALGVTIGIALLSETIIGLLFGSDYKASTTVLAILALIVPLVSLRAVYGTALLASGAERWHLVASTSGLALWLIVGVPLIRSYGVEGATWACLISEGAVVVGMMWVFSKRRALEGACL